jgi:hypothetical protein
MIFILAISQLLYQMDRAQGIVGFVHHFTYISQIDWISDLSNNRGIVNS